MDKSYIDELLRGIDYESEILPGEHNGFLLNLMVVTSYIIQADGKIMHSEMEFVRNFMTTYFGQEKKERYEKILMELFAKSKQCQREEWVAKIAQCVQGMVSYMTEEQRMLMLNFLIRIVEADGRVDYQEVQTIKDVAKWLEIDLQAAGKIDNLTQKMAWIWTV